MTMFGPLTRAAALVGLMACGGAWTAPAMAAPADVALLKEYIGSWRGRGVLIGADQETVVCRLSLSEGNDDKVNYSGRCTLAGTNLSISGTLAYIDEKSRYEAAMTSNATFSGIAVGQKRNGGIVFNLSERDKEDGPEGKNVIITAQIQLKSAKIQVAFQVVYEESGDSLRAEVPFTKQ